MLFRLWVGGCGFIIVKCALTKCFRSNNRHTVVSVCHITATREVRVCPVIPRKEKENLLLCNTCGLFFYNRGVKLIAGRPESAKQRLRLQISYSNFHCNWALPQCACGSHGNASKSLWHHLYATHTQHKKTEDVEVMVYLLLGLLPSSLSGRLVACSLWMSHFKIDSTLRTQARKKILYRVFPSNGKP